VAKVNAKIRRVKETYRKMKHGLPWSLPQVLVKDLVGYAVLWLNVQRTLALSQNVCPRVLFTGSPVPYKEVSIAFGDYVEAYEGTDNTSGARQVARSIRIKYFLDQKGLGNDEEYNRQIYINNTGWHPPPALLNIENHITNIEKVLKLKQQEVISKIKNRSLPNLTPLQLSALRKLQSNSKIIIKPTDENLGPAVLDTETYVKQVLQEHLNTKHYQLLSNIESRNRYEAFKSALKDLITINIDCLSKAEVIYFQGVLN
jgi:hypothetical protein